MSGGPVAPEDFGRWVRASAPVAASDGTVAWTETAFRPDGTVLRDVWVAAGEEAPRPLTRDGVSGDPAWSPDGESVAWFRRPPGGSWRLAVGDREGATLWECPVDGEPRHPRWDPAGRTILWEYLEDDPNPGGPRVITRLRYQVNGVGYLGNRRWQTALVVLGADRATRLSDPAFHHFTPAWSPDGERIAVVTTRRDEWDLEWVWDLYVTDRAGREWRRLTASNGVTLFPAWSPDGSRLAFLHNHAAWTGSTMDYHLMEVASDGRSQPECLSHALDRGAAEVTEPPLSAGGAPLYEPDGQHLWWLVNQGGRHALTRSDREGQHDPVLWDVGWPAVSPDGVHGALLAYTADRPPVPARLDVAARRLRILRDPNGWLADRSLAAPSLLTVPSPDGPVECWVWSLPAEEGGAPRPGLLNFHGGPHGAFGPYFSMTQQVLASHGYLVAAINYRGSAGWGQAFADLVHANWGPKEGEDGMAVIDALTAAGLLDSSRVGVYGPSYGGFMTLWMVTAYPGRIHAGVGQSALSHVATSVYTIDHWESGATDMGGTPWEIPEYYRDHSPLTRVDRVTAPVLLLHGEDDYTCRLIEAEMMFVGLRWQGKPVELVRYPGESHGFHRSGGLATLVDSHGRLLDWFDRWLGR